MAHTNAVRHHRTNDRNVLREWREYGSPDTTREGFLREDALQCDDGPLPRVSSPCVLGKVNLSTYQVWPLGGFSFRRG